MEIRLQKYLADCGIASRRKCEEHIVAGRVTVNGEKTTELGTKVSESDLVTFDGEVVSFEKIKRYILMNKPVGYITSVSDDRGRQTVIDLVKNEISERVFPIGRLDFDTEGLLLLTNDGELSNKITHPKNQIKKTYTAVLNDVPTIEAIEKLKHGVLIDGKKTAPAKVDWMRDNVLNITIHEGKNRQIRKMFAAIGYEVEFLKRISVGNINLGHVPLGRWRHLTRPEIEYLHRL